MTVTPQVRKLETSANYGKFDIEPLDPGFGTTLGNTLRRVLLSSLWGAAVTSIQIDGVAHEFSAIPHVKEDVTEVILNLKKLCLKSFTEDPVTLLLDVKGPAEVHASHIQANSDVEIVNPDLSSCTLAAKGHLRMELNVERGKGYVPAERNKREGQPIGVIPIDAIFSPVEKANFTVEKTRVGQSTDYDRLLIEVWTDGTMSPEEAVSHAASLFTKHLQLFVNFPDSISRPGTPEKSEQNRLMDTPIEAKAKELRRWVERLITTAKDQDLSARRRVAEEVSKPEVVERLFSNLLPRLTERPGGYTRIIHKGPRLGDAAPMVIIELVD